LCCEGSRDAPYKIGCSYLKGPPPEFAFDRISISGGKSVSFGVSALIGKRETPARTGGIRDYYRQLWWIETQFIVFYDVVDRRAWLVDGLSALLHLVRASLEHSKTLDYPFDFQAKDLKEAGHEHSGKAAARAVLTNEDNQRLKLYKILGETVVEKFEENGRQKETEKTRETWVRFSDRVNDLYRTLENIFDH
jgi:hypothetical protein